MPENLEYWDSLKAVILSQETTAFCVARMACGLNLEEEPMDSNVMIHHYMPIFLHCFSFSHNFESTEKYQYDCFTCMYLLISLIAIRHFFIHIPSLCISIYIGHFFPFCSMVIASLIFWINLTKGYDSQEEIWESCLFRDDFMIGMCSLPLLVKQINSKLEKWFLFDPDSESF